MSTTPLDDLREELAGGRAVVLFGAGVSMAATSGTPTASWVGLLNDGVSYCEALFGSSLPTGWAQRRRSQVASGDLDELIGATEGLTRCLGGPAGGEFGRWLARSIGKLAWTKPAVLLPQAAERLEQVTLLREHAPLGRVRLELCKVEVQSATLLGRLVRDVFGQQDHASAAAITTQAIAAASNVKAGRASIANSLGPPASPYQTRDGPGNRSRVIRTEVFTKSIAVIARILWIAGTSRDHLPHDSIPRLRTGPPTKGFPSAFGPGRMPESIPHSQGPRYCQSEYIRRMSRSPWNLGGGPR
jgi:hypothetical protein